MAVACSAWGSSTWRNGAHYLSGGEKRKVALAGALVMGPELLVLDEPFEGLDPASRGGLIGSAAPPEQGVTMIMTTHDIDAVPEFADYAYVLASGGNRARGHARRGLRPR